jgi:hypothetical protein
MASLKASPFRLRLFLEAAVVCGMASKNGTRKTFKKNYIKKRYFTLEAAV